MKSSETCYLCEKLFNSIDVVKHEEHIIQNAIGGKLRSDSILCEKCGETLGGTVDAPFVNAVSSLSGIIAELARDRGDPQPALAELQTSQRLLNCSGVTFRLNNSFELVPSKPIYIQDEAKKEATVFAATGKLAK
ncbi:HNH endonuclease [Glaciimonas immobilis]|uniref:HNH endonuclease 5 domain-containing protein n=1 Tax=Glaciimonas immobilis TaxID=728004 RepID=A0A840RS51_9BURK|nr:HNH endonuclease [Glaciimonas immobilis]KAF3997003.1 HNH endonuclease [Glaciimonas immobilis]MBB5199838.1 hypothetical protein [Glaciimonas immobilis]